MAIDEELKKLRKKLYDEKETFKPRLKREALSPYLHGAKTYWKDDVVKPQSTKQKIEARRKRIKPPLIIVVVVLAAVVVIAAGGYYLWREIFVGGNIVSSGNINISVEGPSIIKGGERNKWYVLITNNNKASLELADLVINYPEGTMTVGGVPISRERKNIGEIFSGETKKVELDIFILGEQDELKEMLLSFEYRLKGSNAIFAKESKNIIKFSSSPIGVFIDLPDEKESGQPIELAVEFVSNSEVALRDVYVQIEYPPGFQFRESSLAPVRGNNLWLVGVLQPQEKRTFVIKGVIEGQDLMELSFRVLVGSSKDGSDLLLLGSATESILLKKPFLNLNFLVDGREINAVFPNKVIRINVPWKSNLATEVRDANIEVKILGAGVNVSSIRVGNGFYRGYDSTLVWNVSSEKNLSLIAPGDEGVVGFSFEFYDKLPVNGLSDKNFTVRLDGKISALRSGSGGQVSTVDGEISRELKVSSQIEVVPSVSYGSGPFINSGPIPPEVGKETTYTITWAVSNFYNDMGNVIVHAALPSYVRWLGTVNPSNEEVVFRASTGEVVWYIDDLAAGTGISRPKREVSFQISFLPAPNQINLSPELMLKSTMEGKDLFTNVDLVDVRQAVSTRSIPEAKFESNKGVVR